MTKKHVVDKLCGVLQASFSCRKQRAKKVVSDSLGLVDFATGLVNSVRNLPDQASDFFGRIQITEEL